MITELKISTLLLFALVGCSAPEISNPYFEFDDIDCYSIEVDEMDLIELEGNDKLEKGKRLMIDLVLNDYPESLSDSTELINVLSHEFVKREIKTESYKEIKDVFSPRKCDEVLATACIAVYRDVLIFKKEKRTIGIAKICFDCGKHHIYGTSESTLGFGQCGGYSELSRILNQ